MRPGADRDGLSTDRVLDPRDEPVGEVEQGDAGEPAAVRSDPAGRPVSLSWPGTVTGPGRAAAGRWMTRACPALDRPGGVGAAPAARRRGRALQRQVEEAGAEHGTGSARTYRSSSSGNPVRLSTQTVATTPRWPPRRWSPGLRRRRGGDPLGRQRADPVSGRAPGQQRACGRGRHQVGGPGQPHAGRDRKDLHSVPLVVPGEGRGGRCCRDLLLLSGQAEGVRAPRDRGQPPGANPAAVVELRGRVALAAVPAAPAGRRPAPARSTACAPRRARRRSPCWVTGRSTAARQRREGRDRGQRRGAGHDCRPSRCLLPPHRGHA